MYFDCYLVKKAYPGKFTCCDSCHDEWEYGASEPQGDGENFSLCCGSSIFLESLGIDIYETTTDKKLIAAWEAEYGTQK